MPPIGARRAKSQLSSLTTCALALFFVIGSAHVARAQSVTPGAPGAAGAPTPIAAIAPIETPEATAPAHTGSPSDASDGSPEPSPSPSPATGRRLAAFFLDADRIEFYSSRYVLGADGHVDAKLGDGTHITGNTFAMDLRLNRFIIAGNVTVTAGGITQHGAAFSEFFDFDRAYFVPITSKPDRWTFSAGDYAHPLLGREMPGDTFFLPDLSGDRVFLSAEHAMIDPHQSVRFTPASVNFGLGQFIRFPSYFLNFSPNPNFAQNSLPGAFIDGPLDFAGGEHALLTAHIRYDSLNKIFPAIEGHLVSDNSYLVGSISPLTRPLKQYNLLAFDRLSPGLQIQSSFQETTFQHSFEQPLSATGYVANQITGSLRQSYLQLFTQNYYDSLLAMPAPVFFPGNPTPQYFYGDGSHNFVPDHPVNLQLSLIGFKQKLGSLLRTQVRSQLTFAYNRDTTLFTLGNTPYYGIYGKALGADISTEPLALVRDKRTRRPKVYLSAVFDKQRTYYSLPHFVDQQQETISLTDIVKPRKLTALFSYSNENTGDFYGAQQNDAYPPGSTSPYIDPYTGQIIPGYNTFRGFATTRSLREQIVYTPTQVVTINASLRENHDFPAPVAGLATIVGPTTSFQNFGVSPYEADLELRYRFTNALVLDVSRAYYFSFGGFQRYSPQFYLQILR